MSVPSQIHRFRRTRDLLRSRLMSGQVELKTDCHGQT